MTVVTLGALAGAALVTGLVLTEATRSWDDAAFEPLTSWDRPFGAHIAARVVVTAGAFWLMTTLVVLAAAARAWQLRRPLLLVLAGAVMGGMDLLLYLMKLLTGRTAPHSGVDQLHAGGASFPSGHTAHAVVGFVLLATLIAGPLGRRGWVVALGAGAVIGWTNLTLGYHWITDVVAGYLLAVAVAVPAAWLLTRLGADPVASERVPGDRATGSALP